ncbi:hypothetical protein L208DRAFT_1288077, partial [Tricholoma matsutake]
LAIFQKDLNFSEQEIRRVSTAPQGFPESEWKHIFKGEAVNLDVIFSNLHHILHSHTALMNSGNGEITCHPNSLQSNLEHTTNLLHSTKQSERWWGVDNQSFSPTETGSLSCTLPISFQMESREDQQPDLQLGTAPRSLHSPPYSYRNPMIPMIPIGLRLESNHIPMSFSPAKLT